MTTLLNREARGRRWQVFLRWPWPVFATGFYPRRCYYTVFRWWLVGPFDVRRFAKWCEYEPDLRADPAPLSRKEDQT